jgi:N6-adenosine-specific RNA methylase IME4
MADAIAIPPVPVHPLANLFPMMTESAHRELVADIKQNGLLHPIVMYEGAILDGRNRFQACGPAGVQPIYEDLPTGVDALQYVVSTNYARRHLSESQRAIAAARIQEHKVNRETAAKQFKLKVSTVRKAESVLSHGVPELVHAVEDDRIPVNVASKLVQMPDDAQREAVILDVKNLRGLIKRQTRIKRSVALAKATARETEKLGNKVYPILVADPAWKWEPFGEGGKDRAAENHYPVMTFEEIRDFPVPAADNAVMFLWCTPSMLKQGMAVLEAWGFEYKSQFVWVKNRIVGGTGYWNRADHELLLVGMKGNIPAPEPGDRINSTIHADVGEHSEKPAVILDAIESWYPNLPKIELFARKRREGWDAHGNELPDEPTQAAAD